MPRPAPPEKLINTAVRLPASTHRNLHEAAGARAVSVNRLVVRAVEHYLQTLRPVEEAFAQRPQ
jgi:predicted HicB family RNase H-like nuclease